MIKRLTDSLLLSQRLEHLVRRPSPLIDDGALDAKVSVEENGLEDGDCRVGGRLGEDAHAHAVGVAGLVLGGLFHEQINLGCNIDNSFALVFFIS